MAVAAPLLIVSFGIILFAAELFTNGVEWLGLKLGLGHGAIGSILAALGTAMPETLIPVIAIIFVGSADSSDVGIGAILGAPFLLSTAAMSVTGGGILAYQRQRRNGTRMHFEADAIRRDMTVFFGAYVVGIGCSFLPSHPLKDAAAVLLLLTYGVYAYRTLMGSEAGDESEEDMPPLRLHRVMAGVGSPPTWLTWLQAMGALALIIGGAYLFVSEMDRVSDALSLPPLLLALVVAPLATELPETFNSVIWVRQSKDTLAMGNISGAMVFQSCIPVSIGLAFTDWKLTQAALVSAAIALISTGIVYTSIRSRGYLSAHVLARAGLLWVGFVTYVIIKISI
ncbi:MAG TPA: sodium:calcium antiporter [Dehalococcoidia bacterium]|nr:sodium:calcium antiporter [Dehalococcoidia bacterium]